MPSGPFTGLPKPPIRKGKEIDQMELMRWFDRIWFILSGLPGIAWRVIDKTGSNLTDLETRNHNDLQNRSAASVHPHSSLSGVLGGGDQHHVQSTERAELTAIDALGAGVVAKTADATYAARTITGTSGAVTVSNGNGGSGNPTIDLPELISTPRKFGGATDNSAFEADGTLVFTGAATVWQDIDFPIIIRTTGAGIPTLTTVNGNLTMPQWAVNDFNMCESQEFIHLWKEGTTCYWHIHLTTNGLDGTDRYVRFELEYGYNNGGSTAWTFPAVVDTGDLLIPANTTDKTMLVLSLANFTPASAKIMGHVIARLKRIAATGTAPSSNPWIPMLQLHVECDTAGSRQMQAK